MIVTVTNTCHIAGVGVTLNETETYTSGSGPAGIIATGGNRVRPLPYPFGHIGTLAHGGTSVLSVHLSDFRYKSVPWLPKEPGQEWTELVTKGWVTFSAAAEATSMDQEDIFANLL